MGIQTHFDKFHDRIKLGREDEAYKKARERDDSIKKGGKICVQGCRAIPLSTTSSKVHLKYIHGD